MKITYKLVRQELQTNEATPSSDPDHTAKDKTPATHSPSSYSINFSPCPWVLLFSKQMLFHLKTNKYPFLDLKFSSNYKFILFLPLISSFLERIIYNLSFQFLLFPFEPVSIRYLSYPLQSLPHNKKTNGPVSVLT